ncbi:SDR family NAD(P)-dependent oxidoreductase [Motiliproteus coralliicola]|uniref:SDR family NAD(P)-dependent oxidoreductase n=1 Tax=Motiliproteus coralliicola TaxID=2283196 RepID=A0A369WT04_9GAMM|nr:SDR family oxidoreductase [Motiliproteus coralliicola]RDE25228.1 SDR family NAD(P)-dependent oxidoreductase [Motiliproteus coralliicola]
MKQTVVITGASRGIGLSLTKLYLSKGCNVFALCRQASADLSTSGATVVEGIDMADDGVIERLKSALAGVRIDLLINNAGILRNEILGQIEFDSLRQQFEVNTLGPIRAVEALGSNLVNGAKLAMITSRMGSVADNTSGGRYGYRMSKAALNIAAVSMAHDLSHQGVSVAIIHPGLVGTEMIGGHGDITPDQAAERIAQRIEGLTPETSGTFWHSNGEVLPW